MGKEPPIDRWQTVDLHDDEAVRMLTEHLACTVGELRMAVQRVGPTFADVRNYVMRLRSMDERWQAARVLRQRRR
jgi:hypothetical protein